jgi:hypothetical protein
MATPAERASRRTFSPSQPLTTMPSILAVTVAMSFTPTCRCRMPPDAAGVTATRRASDRGHSPSGLEPRTRLSLTNLWQSTQLIVSRM